MTFGGKKVEKVGNHFWPSGEWRCCTEEDDHILMSRGKRGTGELAKESRK